MKSHRFLAHCLSTPWAMTPDAMAMYAAMLIGGYAKRDGFPVAAIGHEGEERTEPQAAAPRRQGGRTGGIALINVFGPIVQRASQLGMCEAGVGTDQIAAALDAAMADETVSQVLMCFDTPGGSVFGVDELATKIRSLKAQKPIIGVADSLCASAGYYLMSQCTECYCTPGGMVGSVGVYTAHQYIGKAMEQAGLDMTLISAGDYKTEGNPFEPLSDEARAWTQQSVDGYKAAFDSAVAKGRGKPVETVRNDFGKGRCFSASQAKDCGMVDDILTFDQVVNKMARGAKQTPAGRSARAQQQIAAQLAILNLS